jgi:hypothetical protein
VSQLDDLDKVTRDFQQALIALGQDAQVQVSRYPSFVYTGDELVIDFDEARRAFIKSHGSTLSSEQEQSINCLDHRINELSGEHNLDFWLDRDSLFSDSRWDELRTLAQETVRVFGWQDEKLESLQGQIYVGESNDP